MKNKINLKVVGSIIEQMDILDLYQLKEMIDIKIRDDKLLKKSKNASYTLELEENISINNKRKLNFIIENNGTLIGINPEKNSLLIGRINNDLKLSLISLKLNELNLYCFNGKIDKENRSLEGVWNDENSLELTLETMKTYSCTYNVLADLSNSNYDYDCLKILIDYIENQIINDGKHNQLDLQMINDIKSIQPSHKTL